MPRYNHLSNSQIQLELKENALDFHDLLNSF
jgi:hypothetical protein